MKSVALLFVCCLSLGITGAVHAEASAKDEHLLSGAIESVATDQKAKWEKKKKWMKRKLWREKHQPRPVAKPVRSVPELDGSTTPMAITLLLALLACMREKQHS